MSFNLTVLLFASLWLQGVMRTSCSSPTCKKSNLSSKPKIVPTAAKSALPACKLLRLVRLSWAVILNFMFGCSFWNSAIRLGIMCSSGMVLATMRMVPDRVCFAWEIFAFASCASCSMRSAVAFRVAPASVTSTPLLCV